MSLRLMAKRQIILSIAVGTVLLLLLCYNLSRGSAEYQPKPYSMDRTERQQKADVSTPHQPDIALNSDTISDTMLLEKCHTYKELRTFNFLQPALRDKLCRNVVAYELLPEGYPMCVLPNPFNQDIMKVVKQNSEPTDYMTSQNSQIQLVVFKGDEATSQIFKDKHRYWESEQIKWLTQFALKFMPDVTFIDIGCNLGVYTLEAASLGLPVVSLEANIRNLLRVRLSLDTAKLNADLVWNYISLDRELKYMNFPDACSLSYSSGKVKMAMKDTVPIMPLEADKLRSLIKTKNLVIKVDIEGGEPDFLKSSSRLFADYTVVAVQMEWNMEFVNTIDTAYLIKFFTDRGYKMWRVQGFIPIVNVSSVNSQGSWDILSVHPQFIHMM